VTSSIILCGTVRLRNANATGSLHGFCHIAISARLTHGDLIAVDAALEAGPTDEGLRLILLKQLLVSCGNVSDLELICRALYKDYPAISEIITPHRRNFEFAKYIRNIAVGHVNPALSQKRLEWRPELNVVLTKPGAPAEAFLGYAVLESSINTFVDGERHRIFEGDTDLAYPPDLTRFLNFLRLDRACRDRLLRCGGRCGGRARQPAGLQGELGGAVRESRRHRLRLHYA
jgi:hypothetical protein